MDLKFTVSGRISKPVDEVFEAVANPDYLSKFFTTGGAQGRLQASSVVTWDFHDFPGAFPVHVIEVEQNRLIVLRWDAAKNSTASDSSGKTTVTIMFEPLDDARTLVRISEYGWSETQEGLAASYGNCEGWTGMLCAMKMWLEHGINLRNGFYQ